MKKYFLLPVIFAVTLYSCKKSDNTTPNIPADNSSKIKTWAGSTYATEYSYDSYGRCTQELYSNGAKSTFDYNAGEVVRKHFTSAGVNDATYVFQIGADGVAVKETRPQYPTYSTVSIYNTEKQLVKQITTNNGITYGFDSFFSNGNCDSTRFNNNGTWSSSVIYTYFTDKINSLSNETQGTSFYGKDSKNLLKTEIYKYPDGSNNGLITYSYEFDAMGRATKSTESHNGNLSIDYITYF